MYHRNIDYEHSATVCPDVKNYKDGLTRSGTGCFIAVPIWQQWPSKGFAYSV